MILCNILLGCYTLSKNMNSYFLLQAWIKSQIISLITLLLFWKCLQLYVHQQLQKPFVTDYYAAKHVHIIYTIPHFMMQKLCCKRGNVCRIANIDTWVIPKVRWGCRETVRVTVGHTAVLVGCPTPKQAIAQPARTLSLGSAAVCNGASACCSHQVRSSSSNSVFERKRH
jgi:hypothetical protein